MCGSAPSQGQMGLAPGSTGGPGPSSPGGQINFNGVTPGQNGGFGAGPPIGPVASNPTALPPGPITSPLANPMQGGGPITSPLAPQSSMQPQIMTPPPAQTGTPMQPQIMTPAQQPQMYNSASRDGLAPQMPQGTPFGGGPITSPLAPQAAPSGAPGMQPQIMTPGFGGFGQQRPSFGPYGSGISPAFSAGNVTGGLTPPSQNPFAMLWGGY